MAKQCRTEFYRDLDAVPILINFIQTKGEFKSRRILDLLPFERLSS